jgi:hypothetical protein
MAASDEVVFAWAVGKVLLIVIASFSIVLYVSWAGTGRMLRSSGKQRSATTSGRELKAPGVSNTVQRGRWPLPPLFRGGD